MFAAWSCDSGHVKRQNNGILFSPWIYIWNQIVPAFQYGRSHAVMQIKLHQRPSSLISQDSQIMGDFVLRFVCFD